MNKEGREAVAKLQGLLEEATSPLQDLHTSVEELAEEERSKFDNMPESLQGSERGEAMDAAASALENAASEIQTAINSLEEAATYLGEVGEA